MGCTTCGGYTSRSSYSNTTTTNSNGTTTTTSSSSSTYTSGYTGGRTFGSYQVKNGYNGAYALQKPTMVNKLGVKRKSTSDQAMNLSLAEQAFLELNKKYQR